MVATENYPDFVVPLAKTGSDGNNKQNRTDWVNGIEAAQHSFLLRGYFKDKEKAAKKEAGEK